MVGGIQVRMHLACICLHFPGPFPRGGSVERFGSGGLCRFWCSVLLLVHSRFYGFHLQFTWGFRGLGFSVCR